ncbi:serine/threonine-protein kinase Sgk2 [Nemania abortiva]|nr:serine/threonine-protein kinase Sgk2 [Nemania abortiva]
MGQLTPKERDAIERNPLGSLDDIRQSLRDAESIATVGTSRSDEDDGADRPLRLLFNIAMQELFVVFILSDAALQLASRAGQECLNHDLVLVRKRIASHSLEYRHLRPLSLSLINEAPDVDVWTAVINLIPEVLGSSVSPQDLEDTQSYIEALVANEIRYCTYRAVEGFHEKYFASRTWNTRARRVWESVKSHYSDKRWAQLPDGATGDELGQWWLSMQSDLLANEQAAYYRSTSNSGRNGLGASSHFGLVVKRRRKGEEADCKTHNWKHVLAVGELKKTKNNSEALWLHLGSVVRNVFIAQPARLFVHAFTLTGATIETWVFDRSGPYSGAAFDIHEQPEKSMQVMCGYLMMSNEELGLDTFTERRDDGLHVKIPTEAHGTKQMREFGLDANPMAFQRGIVSRGTSCFFAKAKGSFGCDSVVKFSWTSGTRPPEADLLRKANERGVKGLAKVVGYHEEITSISELRKGLKFSTPYTLRSVSSDTDESSSSSQLPTLSPLRQSTSPSNGAYRQIKRKSIDEITHLPKRRRRGSQVVEVDSEGNGDTYSFQEPQGPSLSSRVKPQETYKNRVLRVLAVSPTGRSIRQFRSGVELLQSLRDAICAHRSLYLDGRILHRDISENNIIITDPAKADGFRGMLIDLDLAEEEGEGASDARHMAGTLEFMAIEVLLGASHTYRHDLESFFYVLIWLCARRGWDNPPHKSMLARWSRGSYVEIAQGKRGDMDAGGLEVILREFPPKFEFIKPLCRELRDILFPYRRCLFTGTPRDPKVLYDPIVKAFDDVLAEMSAKRPST